MLADMTGFGAKSSKLPVYNYSGFPVISLGHLE